MEKTVYLVMVASGFEMTSGSHPEKVFEKKEDAERYAKASFMGGYVVEIKYVPAS